MAIREYPTLYAGCELFVMIVGFYDLRTLFRRDLAFADSKVILRSRSLISHLSRLVAGVVSNESWLEVSTKVLRDTLDKGLARVLHVTNFL